MCVNTCAEARHPPSWLPTAVRNEVGGGLRGLVWPRTDSAPRGSRGGVEGRPKGPACSEASRLPGIAVLSFLLLRLGFFFIRDFFHLFVFRNCPVCYRDHFSCDDQKLVCGWFFFFWKRVLDHHKTWIVCACGSTVIGSTHYPQHSHTTSIGFSFVLHPRFTEYFLLCVCVCCLHRIKLPCQRLINETLWISQVTCRCLQNFNVSWKKHNNKRDKHQEQLFQSDCFLHALAIPLVEANISGPTSILFD